MPPTQPQLSQMLALETRSRAAAVQALAKALADTAKDGPLSGIERRYRPNDVEGTVYPPESTRVQITVDATTQQLAAGLSRWWDITATRDKTNTGAKADVVVDGVALLSNVPAPFLVWFEKQLDDLRKYFANLPLLDPAVAWELDGNTGSWRAAPEERIKTKKVLRNHEVSPATKEHPAKVHVFEEDVPEGVWEATKFSGAIRGTRRQELVDRLDRLIEAVTIAREEANRHPVTDFKVGDVVFGYLLA